MPIAKLLVANRGEIAVRIFRTCRELGIATVAVVAPDDRGSLHARSADEAVEIPSYLDAGEHVRAAKQAGADAIHPGYGFLAENASFADAVEAAGLTWVGPPAEALRLGGDKIEAKRVAREAGVPVLPSGTPDEVGFPLVVKAAAGGGGRGMRVVRTPQELDDAREAAEREATTAFADGTLYLERYLERPRHVEVQLLADAHGNVLALGERDCSVQRRHQKVLEEAPAPALAPRLREALLEAAVAFGRAIGYRSAGTVEFVVDGEEFFFLELNGRIQVEHPVTELVTGLDLVAEQLRIAAGEALVAQSQKVDGHAVEVRLYAEDPRTFLPQTGRVERLLLPDGVRVDAGVEEGDEVGIAYDPMIAKLVAHGTTREEALDRLRGRARRDRGRRRHHEPSIPALARPAPRRPGGRSDDGVSHGAPAAVAAAAGRDGGAVAAALAAQPPPSTTDSAAGRRRRVTPGGGRAEREQHGHRAHARHRHPGRGRAGSRDAGPPGARRPRGDEDGDPGALAVRWHRERGPRRTGRPRGGRHTARRARELARRTYCSAGAGAPRGGPAASATRYRQ